MCPRMATMASNETAAREPEGREPVSRASEPGPAEGTGVCFVVPAYREEANIAGVIRMLREIGRAHV